MGFVIHPEKSVLLATQEIKFLGFTINSISMKVWPTHDKCQSLVELCKRALRHDSIKIEEAASLAGKIVSMFPGAQYGPFYYRELKREKSNALRLNTGNWKAIMTLWQSSRRTRMVGV